MFKLLEISLLSLVSMGMPLKISDSVVELPNEHQTPKMITMNLYSDSASQMAFRWNTDYRADSDLQVIKASDGDFNSANLLEFSGKTEKSRVQNDGFIHSVVATDLEKNTKYLYRLGDKELNLWSDVGSFTTENDNEYTSFLHISDPQVMEELHSSTYSELLGKITSEVDLDFMCVSGDLVNSSWVDHNPILEQWDLALTNQAEYLQNIPMMAVAGNHEAADYDFASRFNLPIDDLNQDVKSGVYYSYDYHNIHFICLNTNDTLNPNSPTDATGLSNAQIEWLKNDLEKSKDAEWKIVMMHKGIYDAGSHASNKDGEDYDIALIRKQLAPLFSKYNVDLVLQGHDHLYSRSYPIESSINNNELVSKTKEEEVIELSHDDQTYRGYLNPSGPIYVNTGSASGSKYYGVTDYDSKVMPIEKAYGPNNRMLTSYYVEDNTLYANVYEIVNGELSLYDTFAIKKEQVHVSDDKVFIKVIFIVTSVIVSCGAGVGLFFVLNKDKYKEGN
ncbi:MAG: metallophosphoesterase family protein [Erysipelotrichales bacterium]|nr:metallophosphoesterase family protein [Erysipelotrichales bacterium]